ncbi:MAG: family 10 glycosylhydrolase [Chloroflexi bacterium]|nr:family 10 glycosylhydrolase [Chloroflexota bacterium]
MLKRMLAASGLFFLIVLSAASQAQEDPHDIYLPIITKPEPTSMVEFRGLWVTRFDWTSYGAAADPAKIDEIVQNAALAGFNVIFFQVRGTADAFYQSDIEPWAQRVSGIALGQPPDPLWDPLAYMVQLAHAAGIQVHAYMNVYPVWSDCDNLPDPNAEPTHFYYLLQNEHGETDGKLNGLQWYDTGEVLCDVYQRATPASAFGDDHYLAIAADLVARYDIDGIHLDNIRYGDSNASYDPVSQANYDDAYAYGEWQRRQVNGTVRKFYEQIVPLKEGLWLSAAVWPVHQKKPEWGWTQPYQEGYSTYYQDSKAWLVDGYIDSISPMIYPGGAINCPDDNEYWTQERWGTLVEDYVGDGNGRYIIPGIGAKYCTFDEIEARISLGRQAGAAGHALFSYGGLLTGDYFDDLANGPHMIPATVPKVAWHP